MSANRPALLDSYWKDIRHCVPVSRKQEIDLVRRARDGDGGAMHDLITANVRFVVAVAREFRGTGCPMNGRFVATALPLIFCCAAAPARADSLSHLLLPIL